MRATSTKTRATSISLFSIATLAIMDNHLYWENWSSTRISTHPYPDWRGNWLSTCSMASWVALPMAPTRQTNLSLTITFLNDELNELVEEYITNLKVTNSQNLATIRNIDKTRDDPNKWDPPIYRKLEENDSKHHNPSQPLDLFSSNSDSLIDMDHEEASHHRLPQRKEVSRFYRARRLKPEELMGSQNHLP